MKHPLEYTWLESYLDNDSLWLEDSVNWDNILNTALADFTLAPFFTASFFLNSHFFLDSLVKMSFIDVMFFSESSVDEQPFELFNYVLWDSVLVAVNLMLSFQMLMFSDNQDFLLTAMHHSPEICLAVTDYLQLYWDAADALSTPTAMFDVYDDSLDMSLEEWVEYLYMFLFFIWGACLFSGVLRNRGWVNPFEIYITRLQAYFAFLSSETRLANEATSKIFFFGVFYVFMMIATFDDDQEELMEYFHELLLAFFCMTAAHFVFKYTVHFFAFLEASSVEGRSVSYVTTQFSRDFINTFAFVLRTSTLLLRLNIYDSLDDFYDSYYIFFGDFDDDEYLVDLFFAITATMCFDTDVNDDRSFFFEDEVDVTIDLFAMYFIVFGKFFFFMFFIVEEIVRVILALYILHLIIFEVHSVNRSYVEDMHLFIKRDGLDKKLGLCHME